MGLPSSTPIGLFAVQGEWNSSSLIGASNVSGFGNDLTDFLGTESSLFCSGVMHGEWRNGSSSPLGIYSRSFHFNNGNNAIGSPHRTFILCLSVERPSSSSQPTLTPRLRRLSTGASYSFSKIASYGSILTGAYGVGTTYQARADVYMFKLVTSSAIYSMWEGGNDLTLTVDSNVELFSVGYRLFSVNATNYITDIKYSVDSTTSTRSGVTATFTPGTSNCFILGSALLYGTFPTVSLVGWSSNYGADSSSAVLDSETYYANGRDSYRILNLQQNPSSSSHTVSIASNQIGSPHTNHRSIMIATLFKGQS